MSKFKKSIFFVITGLGQGGAEKTLVELISQMKKRDSFYIRVFVLTNLNFFQPVLEKLGIQVNFIPIGFNFTWIKQTIIFFREIRQYKPIVSTWLYHADIFGGILARIAGVRNIIWSARQTNLSFKANPFKVYLAIRICAFASYFIPREVVSCAYSAKQSHLMVGYNKSNLKVIQNGYDVSKVFKLCKNNLTKKYSVVKQIKIIHIGRNDFQKNQLGFLQVAELISKELPNTEFLMIGSRVTLLENMVDMSQFPHIKLGHNLFLMDETENIQEIFKSSHCLVQTSVGEGFPNVVAEACLAGVPVVATDVGDTKFILGETLELISPFDPKFLSAKVIHVLNMDIKAKLDLIYRQHNFVKKNFSIDKMTQQFLDLFGG